LIVITVAGTGNSAVDATSYATTSFTPTANSVLLCYVFATGTASAGSMTGGSLTWSLVASQVYNTVDKAYLFQALVGSSPVSTTPTFSCVDDGATGATMRAFQATGADHTNPLRQFAQGSGSTSDPSVTFDDALLTSNAYLACFGIPRNPPASTAPSGWTESFDTGYSPPTAGSSGGFRVNGETVSSVTFTTASGAWGMIAAEIQAGGTAGEGGGAIEITNGSDLELHICLLDANTTAGGAGGAIHQSGGTLLVTKSTFDANSALVGSHAYVASGIAIFHDDILINAPQGYGVYEETGGSVAMTTDALFANLPDHLFNIVMGTSVEVEPQFCPVASPSGTDPSEFEAYRLFGGQTCATMGTRASDFGAEDPLLIPVVGCSAVACGRWQDVITPTVQSGDCEIAVCDYASYAGDYDTDWAEILAKPTGVDHRTIICLDPDGMAHQLTGLLLNMRPLVTQRDVKFQEYQGQDIDLEFTDPEGILDPAVPGSILFGVDWRGLKVSIGSWLVGTERVLKQATFYLDDVRAAEGVVFYRCKDAFSKFQDVQVRANTAINLTDTSDTGALAAVTVNVAFAAIETWTLTFTTTSHFQIKGSLTGSDGESDTADDFTSTTGAITVLAADWSGSFLIGDTVTFESVAQYGPDNLFTIARQMLTDNTDLVSSDFDDDTWNDAIASFSLHEGTFTQHDPIDALSLLRLFMRHGPATAYPDEDGQIAVSHFLPRIGVVFQDTICETYDLVSLNTERLNIHTSVTIRYAPDVDGNMTLGRRWPRGEPGNFPLTVELPGFGSDDESVVDFIAQRYFALFEEQRELFNIDLLLVDLNRRLDDIAYMRSVLPPRSNYGQFIKLDRDLTGLEIRAQLLEIGWLVQPAGSCGYLFYDAGHRYDMCWIYF